MKVTIFKRPRATIVFNVSIVIFFGKVTLRENKWIKQCRLIEIGTMWSFMIKNTSTSWDIDPVRGILSLSCTFLFNGIYPPLSCQVDNANTFWVLLRTKMWYGMTDGRTETITKSPAAFLAGVLRILVVLIVQMYSLILFLFCSIWKVFRCTKIIIIIIISIIITIYYYYYKKLKKEVPCMFYSQNATWQNSSAALNLNA